MDQDNPLAYSTLLRIEECLWVLTAATGISNYDFRFDAFFPVRHDQDASEETVAIARIGAISHYDLVYENLRSEGIKLLHNPAQYLCASELPVWHRHLADLTPKSLWSQFPLDASVIEAELGWPIFMKGARQTSRHQRALSIIHDADAYKRALNAYARDPILRHQQLVCRQYVPLRPVDEPFPDRIPSSFEFRTFWWKGELAGYGPYWWDGKPYRMNESEVADGLGVAGEAASRIDVPFLVVDIAQAVDGRWLIIECNDAQESGYASISPVGLWQRIIDLERSKQ